MEIKILGHQIKEEKDFHIQFSYSLGIEKFYGHNLDALWDILSGGLEHPTHLIWYNSLESKKNLGEDFDKISSVLEEARLEYEEYEDNNKLFTYTLK